MNTFSIIEDPTGVPVEADEETEDRTGKQIGEHSDCATPPTTDPMREPTAQPITQRTTQAAGSRPARPARELANNSPSDIEVITEAWI